MSDGNGAAQPPQALEAATVKSRLLYINDKERTFERAKEDKGKTGNYVSTTKYSLLTFVPKNLFEQFQRFANVYFLILLLMQLYRAISSLEWQSTFVPLMFVLMVTAIKDGYEDYKRWKSDRQINNSKTLRFESTTGKWISCPWRNVKLGDILKVKLDEKIPADMVIYTASSPAGECYIETADLDGETNLKRKYSLESTHTGGEGASGPSIEESLKSKKGTLKFDYPNTLLEKFNGAIKFEGDAMETPVSNENVILRGCILRNTSYIVGQSVYCGTDTKIMKNSGATRQKRTQMDLRLNVLVITVFLCLLVLSAFGAIINAVWLGNNGLNFMEAEEGYNFFYNAPEDTASCTHPADSGDTPGDNAFCKGWYDRRFTELSAIAGLQFLSYIILMNTFIPISLYVSIEFVRLGQSLLISYDPFMFDTRTEQYSQARSTSLSEDLGQIDYVFSDKTGTLTQNVMVFQQCSIAGHVYGKSIDDCAAETAEDKARLQELWAAHNDRDPCPDFADEGLISALKEGNQDVAAFFRLMAVCHTVRPDKKGDGTIEYQAESPDEKALVDASREVGFTFVDSLESVAEITVPGGAAEKYEILHVIEFDSTRKRMSIICKDMQRNGAIRLFSKGADNIMSERLSGPGRSAFDQMTGDLDAFARTGLRTLVMAEKTIPEAEYAAWNARYHEAETSIEGREDNMERLASEIEMDLDLVGASAIEDKLQDGVPDTISKIKEGGIKLWVLTGDKRETAENIGASCKLLTQEMEPLHRITGSTHDEVKAQIADETDKLETRKLASAADVHPAKFALVVTGHALLQILKPNAKELLDDKAEAKKTGNPRVWTADALTKQSELETAFIKLAKNCNAVLACRVSPLQKAKVVQLVKSREGAITLAIGDGANDVSMIKTAHIGVGISGLEGRQAVLASDFSIGQFRFLGRLLLVHGRWSYYRMCRFLRYFFYKNVVFTTCQFWFAFYSGGSAQTNFDPLFVSFFNVVFASVPIIVISILEQDVDAKHAIAKPMLYEAGPKNLYFTYKHFFFDLCRGLVHSLFLFFSVVGAVAYGGGLQPDGKDSGDLMTLGVMLGFNLVMIVNIQLAVEIKHWTWAHYAGVVLGPLAWLFLFGIIYSFSDFVSGMEFSSRFFGAFVRVLGSPQAWLSLILGLAVCCLPNLFTNFIQEYNFPTPMDLVRTWMMGNVKKERAARRAVAAGEPIPSLDAEAAQVLEQRL